MTSEADPAAVLDGLLERVVSGLEVQAETDLRGSRSFYQRDGCDEIEDTIREFGVSFDRVADALADAWGPPAYGDQDLHGDDVNVSRTVAEDLYWAGAVRLAAWERRPGVFAYVAIQHADVELPVLLILGARRFPPP
jgi:hypothetical protein